MQFSTSPITARMKLCLVCPTPCLYIVPSAAGWQRKTGWVGEVLEAANSADIYRPYQQIQ
jgi:hypothetical protein